ncbi:MAG: hypothetical protein QXK27_04205, partial [Candidatus Hadarchaeales archaeon]
MMAELISLLGLGISIIAAQIITTRSTQRILNSNQRILEEIYGLQKEMALYLRKIDVGMRANALMHGWQRVDGISPEEARQ